MEENVKSTARQPMAWSVIAAALVCACLDAVSLPNAAFCCLCFDLLAFVLLLLHRALPAQVPAGLRILCYSPAGALVYVLAVWLGDRLFPDHGVSFLIYWVPAAISLIQELPVNQKSTRSEENHRFLLMLCVVNGITLLAGILQQLFIGEKTQLFNGTYAFLFLFSLHPLLGCVQQYIRADEETRTELDPIKMGLTMMLFAPFTGLLHWVTEQTLGAALAKTTLSVVFRQELMRAAILIGLCLPYLAAVLICALVGGELSKSARPFLMRAVFSCAMLGICAFQITPGLWNTVLRSLNIGICYVGFAFLYSITAPVLAGTSIPKALRGGPAVFAFSIVFLVILRCLGL